MALVALQSDRTNLQKVGSDFLADRQRETLSVDVTIIRAQSRTENVPAVIGRTEFERTDSLNLTQTFQTRDFLIHHVEYKFDSVQANPEAGDRIEETVDETVYLYEVMEEQGNTLDGFSDDHRKLLRIHTKKIEQT